MSAPQITVENSPTRFRTFAKWVVAGHSVEGAAKRAGFSVSEVSGYQLTHHPAVAALIREGLRRRLETRGAPLAYKVLMKLLRDDSVGARVRVDAAKIVLDRAGFAPQDRVPSDQGPKQLSDMSAAELRAFIKKSEQEIAQVEGELASRATPVSAPNVDDDGAQTADFLE